MPIISSFSLGNSHRDHTVCVRLLGETFTIERVGTNGSMEALARLIQANDGRSAIITIGGLHRHLVVDDREWPFRESDAIYSLARRTPVVDGRDFRRWVEPEFVRRLYAAGAIRREQSVLFPVSANRLEMADAFLACGAREVLFGDLIFGLGLPFGMIRSNERAKRTIRALAPVLRRVPYGWLYPLGERQDEILSRGKRFLERTDVLAGDFHGIRRFLIPDLTKKTIVTNTVTNEDRKLLQARGLARLVTFSPGFDGRTFGTNVMQGIVLWFLQRDGLEVNRANYLEVTKALGIDLVIDDLG